MKNEALTQATSTVIAPNYGSAARYFAAVLTVMARTSAKRSIRIVTLDRSREGKLIGVRLTDGARWIYARAGFDVTTKVTPQHVAGIVLASRGALVQTDDKLGIMTAETKAARLTAQRDGAAMLSAFASDVRDVLSGFDPEEVDRIAQGVTFA